MRHDPHFLVHAQLLREKVASFDEYPFCLPAVRSLETLEFHPKVTFLVGENGTGKSTLLEAIAVGLGLNPEGGSRNFNFETRRSHSKLCDFLRLRRGGRRTVGSCEQKAFLTWLRESRNWMQVRRSRKRIRRFWKPTAIILCTSNLTANRFLHYSETDFEAMVYICWTSLKPRCRRCGRWDF